MSLKLNLQNRNKDTDSLLYSLHNDDDDDRRLVPAAHGLVAKRCAETVHSGMNPAITSAALVPVGMLSVWAAAPTPACSLRSADLMLPCSKHATQTQALSSFHSCGSNTVEVFPTAREAPSLHSDRLSFDPVLMLTVIFFYCSASTALYCGPLACICIIVHVQI